MQLTTNFVVNPKGIFSLTSLKRVRMLIMVKSVAFQVKTFGFTQTTTVMVLTL